MAQLLPVPFLRLLYAQAFTRLEMSDFLPGLWDATSIGLRADQDWFNVYDLFDLSRVIDLFWYTLDVIYLIRSTCPTAYIIVWCIWSITDLFCRARRRQLERNSTYVIYLIYSIYHTWRVHTSYIYVVNSDNSLNRSGYDWSTPQ